MFLCVWNCKQIRRIFAHLIPMTETSETPAWSNLNVAQFKAKMKAPQTIVLDVRTAAEIAETCIPGVLTNLDFYNGEFESRFPEMDKDNTYLIYCRSGVRSAHACEMMAAAGFKSLYNLRGGILAWMAER